MLHTVFAAVQRKAPYDPNYVNSFAYAENVVASSLQKIGSC